MAEDRLRSLFRLRKQAECQHSFEPEAMTTVDSTLGCFDVASERCKWCGYTIGRVWQHERP